MHTRDDESLVNDGSVMNTNYCWLSLLGICCHSIQINHWVDFNT